MDAGRLAKLLVEKIRERAQLHPKPDDFLFDALVRVRATEQLPREQQMPELLKFLNELGLVSTDAATLN